MKFVFPFIMLFYVVAYGQEKTPYDQALDKLNDIVFPVEYIMMYKDKPYLRIFNQSFYQGTITSGENRLRDDGSKATDCITQTQVLPWSRYTETIYGTEDKEYSACAIKFAIDFYFAAECEGKEPGTAMKKYCKFYFKTTDLDEFKKNIEIVALSAVKTDKYLLPDSSWETVNKFREISKFYAYSSSGNRNDITIENGIMTFTENNVVTKFKVRMDYNDFWLTPLKSNGTPDEAAKILYNEVKLVNDSPEYYLIGRNLSDGTSELWKFYKK